MLNRKAYKWIRKWIALSLCIGLVLSMTLCGCGKNAETVTDYGKSSALEKDDSSSTAGELTTEVRADSGFIPPAQMQGDPVWEKTIAVDDIPVEISINTLLWDEEPLHAYEAMQITEADVHEEQILRNLFGDTAKKMNCKLDESDELHSKIKDIIVEIYVYVHPENLSTTDNGSTVTETEKISSWFDEDKIFCHCYEGEHEGIKYQLMLCYQRLDNLLYLAFYPANPGDAIHEPKYVQATVVDETGGLMISGRTEYDVVKSKQNRTQMSERDLKRMANAFMKDQFGITLREENYSFVMDQFFNDGKRELLFLPWNYDEKQNGLSESDYKDAILDGYEMEYRGSHLDFFLYHIDELCQKENYGKFQITDNGVFGCTLKIAYRYGKELSDETNLLGFNSMMNAFVEQLPEKLETESLKGYSLTCNEAMLGYYPVFKDEESTACAMIPAWRLRLNGKNPQSGKEVLITVFMNAIDGTMISLESSK